MHKKIFIIILFILFFFLVFERTHAKSYSPENVEFSYEEKDNRIYLTMKSKEDYQIYYTLDGSIPTKNSILYTDTIELNRYSTPDYLVLKENLDLYFGSNISVDDHLPRGVVVRAIAIAPDKTKGNIETKTFFPGLSSFYQNSTIISLVTDPRNLLDYDKGIMIKGKIYDDWKDTSRGVKIIRKKDYYFYEGNYTQTGKEWERDAVIEYFDGSSHWIENCGIRIRGNYSRKYSQKGFNIYFRKEYGTNHLTYELFPDNYSIDGEKISQYKSFSLSNGGNTMDGYKFTDSFIQSLVSDRNVDTQASKLVVVFLNGEYWGVYDLKERYDDEYFAEHYQVHRKNLIVVSQGELDIGEESDLSYYNDLMKYSELDLTNEDLYAEFLSKIDLQSMLDYFAIQIYVENGDWGNRSDLYKNVRLWRVRDPDGSLYGDGKWRWSIFDIGYYANSIRYPDYCAIKEAFKKHPLFASAMKNKKFEKEFYRTLEDIRVHNFNPNHVWEVYQSYYNLWNLYMIDHNRRFGKESYSFIRSSDEVFDYFKKRYRENYC